MGTPRKGTPNFGNPTNCAAVQLGEDGGRCLLYGGQEPGLLLSVAHSRSMYSRGTLRVYQGTFWDIKGILRV